MPGVKYIGPVFDASGYAAAARDYVLAIHEQGYAITLEPISFEPARPDLGEQQDTLDRLAAAAIDYDKVILHCGPGTWAHHGQHELDKYRIGYTTWETSELHPTWRGHCAFVDEVWVPSTWNRKVFESSDIGVPVRVVPHTLALPDPGPPGPLPISLSAETFVFYSIFQWQERKNPAGLIAAYLSAFSGVDGVALVLKTYLEDLADAGTVRLEIEAARARMRLDHYPRIVPLVANLSREELFSLHRRGDCFILLQRAEGWGLPHFEAAACGNPVITPAFGGQTDFVTRETGYLVDYTLRPVSGMSWSPFYLGTQTWCEPDLTDAIRRMRQVYADREEARARGARGRRLVAERFNRRRIGELIVDRLRAIDRELDPEAPRRNRERGRPRPAS